MSGTVTSSDWSVPGQVVQVAPFSICVAYRHPDDGDREDWFDRVTGKMHGMPRDMAPWYRSEVS